MCIAENRCPSHPHTPCQPLNPASASTYRQQDAKSPRHGDAKVVGYLAASQASPNALASLAAGSATHTRTMHHARARPPPPPPHSAPSPHLPTHPLSLPISHPQRHRTPAPPTPPAQLRPAPRHTLADPTR
eukprot:88487-Rhodomonas_salina.1